MPDPLAKHLEVLADALSTPGEGSLCEYARIAGDCPSFCRCPTCPRDIPPKRDRLEGR